MRRWAAAAVLLLVAFAGMAVGYFINPAGIPPVQGYAEGKKIQFIHTEASDAKVAELLTSMMGSPVLVVPSLATAPAEIRARVYVFKNGVAGAGPFGYQPDVFESPPGTNGYSPLRSVVLVTWKNELAARELKSAAEVEEALRKGGLVAEQTAVVVNMPLLTWPGGRR